VSFDLRQSAEDCGGKCAAKEGAVSGSRSDHRFPPYGTVTTAACPAPVAIELSGAPTVACKRLPAMPPLTPISIGSKVSGRQRAAF
jgi:hypothetical protein